MSRQRWVARTTWTEDELDARLRTLTRASWSWWLWVSAFSTAALVGLHLIERGLPNALAALPVLTAGALMVMRAEPGRRRLRVLEWALVLTLASIALASAVNAAAVIVVVAAGMFGAWVVALLAFFGSWGHWGIATLVLRARGAAERVRDQTQQAMSRGQGGIQ